MNSTINTDKVVWRNSVQALALLVIGLCALLFITSDGMAFMVHQWEVREEYSHGYMIPLISAFLLWQKKDVIEKRDFNGSWTGVFIVALGLCIAFLGKISATHVIVQYGFLVTLIGFAYSYTGKDAIKLIIVPLLFLFFMMPLPGIFLFRLSSELQLISSQMGVAVIRLFGISVYLEGNVIDLGVYKLQVVEACSGLRYLFPMISLSFIAAYFFKVELWKRVVIVLSSIPITIFMNSFRIGVIGVLVDNWGIEQAEGFLHYFEGWVVFMFSLIILIIEMWLFAKFSKDKKPFQEVFGLEMPVPTPKDAVIKTRKVPVSLFLSVLILLIALVGSLVLVNRDKPDLVRKDFDVFPIEISEWSGRKERLGNDVMEILKADDYIIADYRNDVNEVVNLYIAYYDSQEAGSAAHSPKSCIPGGGWRIKTLETVNIDDVEMTGQPLSVNRLFIKKGDHGQLVYYWFQQRNRVLTNEYLVKWYLFIDALKENRTDGAMVRLTTPVGPGENLELADKRLIEYAKQIQPLIDDYIPR